MRSHFVSRIGKMQFQVAVEDISHFSAGDKYVTAYHRDGQLLLDEPLKSLEQEFGAAFTRIHRSHLVRTTLVSNFRWQTYAASIRVHGTNHRLPVSRACAASVKLLASQHQGEFRGVPLAPLQASA